jgi:arginine N-succinyltransferase
MVLFRPIKQDDLSDILSLAKECGVGLTTLPYDEKKLAKRIDLSEQSFASQNPNPYDENYLFVLEDTESKKVVGTSAIEANVGHDLPFYSYKLTKRTKVSHDINIRISYNILNIVNDYEGTSELCTLYLTDNYRKNANGLLLSRARFLFMAEFPERFSDKVIAELRGVSDEEGNSPFWDHIGAHFFQIPFSKADTLSVVTNKQFIADLIPRYPIYVQLLDKRAQDVIAKPHKSTVPALKILEQEGFYYNGYVDIFDAGPTIEASLNNIKTVAKSKHLRVNNILDEVNSKGYLISNTNLNFKSTLGHIMINHEEGSCIIDKRCAKALELEVGSELRASPLKNTE